MTPNDSLCVLRPRISAETAKHTKTGRGAALLPCWCAVNAPKHFSLKKGDFIEPRAALRAHTHHARSAKTLRGPERDREGETERKRDRETEGEGEGEPESVGAGSQQLRPMPMLKRKEQQALTEGRISAGM